MVLTSQVANAATQPAICTSTGAIHVAALATGIVSSVECPLVGREVRGAVSGVLIPPPGTSVEGAGLVGPGTPSEELTVTTQMSGLVTATDWVSVPVALEVASKRAAVSGHRRAQPTASGTNPCAYTDYDSAGKRETDNHEWRFNDSTVPSRNGTANVREAAIEAAADLTTGNNNCDLDGSVISARETYVGNTSSLANISSSEDCLSRDSVNVVSFGSLDGNFFAYTCRWANNNPFGWDEITEADIRMSTQTLWNVDGHGTCSGEIDVEDGLTHEWGHAFGLNHVDESTNQYATMSPEIDPCSLREITLGRGDFNGMAHIY
jgi:hypothetical protein